ncbi:MAG TPA: hypothetical protein VFH25_07885 [Nitrososphaeraceae archaeon]|jgi:hypothetical protein|nr:hypothetical protein [Nitrososphaeraceae archaeon]
MATTAASSTNAEKGKEGNRKKLTEVVSTKLSIEDDNALLQVSTIAFQYGSIKEPTKSELVRFLITLLLSSIRKEYERRTSLSKSR